MVRLSDFSLRSLSLSSAVWYVTTALGWGLICVAVVEIARTPAIDHLPALAMTAAMLVLLELLPLVQGRGHDPEGVVMSTACVCAMLFVWGPWPAIAMAVVASVAADVQAHKQWWKVVFNPAQYALSVGAAGAAIALLTRTATLAEPLKTFAAADLGWVVAAWTTYFLVNLFLVAGVLSWTASWRSIVSDDFLHYLTISFAVMSLSPLIVVVSQHAWPLLTLLLIPLLLLYYTASMSLEREHAAGHDSLTGLPNRTTLNFAVNEALEAFDTDGMPFGLLLIDMDDFKHVNDTLGHEVGDRLLIQFAGRLRAHVRDDDLVARLGGDEFAILVRDTHEDEVHAVAERVRTSTTEPIHLEGLAMEVEVSIGIALCPAHATDLTGLLRAADVAMYEAKTQRTGIESYSSDRDHNSTDRLELMGELRAALLENEVELHYQPKVSTVDDLPIGVEALVRWRHPQRGFIPPDEFVPLAERSGIMPLLTAHVVRLAMLQSARWRDQGLIVPVAVNVSPTDLVGDDLANLVIRGLDTHALPATMVKLEITERIVGRQLESSRRTLDRLRALGVTISLDDFGTGYSSLLRLSSLPVDEIKIDRGFVSAMSQSSSAVGIVRALIDLSRALGMSSVAEGVETAEELRLLKSLHCDGVQGWHLARPMDSERATTWLHERLDGVDSHRSPIRLGAVRASMLEHLADSIVDGVADTVSVTLSDPATVRLSRTVRDRDELGTTAQVDGVSADI